MQRIKIDPEILKDREIVKMIKLHRDEFRGMVFGNLDLKEKFLFHIRVLNLCMKITVLKFKQNQNPGSREILKVLI